jgi:hypothetical protein
MGPPCSAGNKASVGARVLNICSSQGISMMESMVLTVHSRSAGETGSGHCLLSTCRKQIGVQERIKCQVFHQKESVISSEQCIHHLRSRRHPHQYLPLIHRHYRHQNTQLSTKRRASMPSQGSGAILRHQCCLLQLHGLWVVFSVCDQIYAMIKWDLYSHLPHHGEYVRTAIGHIGGN